MNEITNIISNKESENLKKIEKLLNKIYKDNNSEFFHDKDLNEFFKTLTVMCYYIADTRSVKGVKEAIKSFNEAEIDLTNLKFE